MNIVDLCCSTLIIVGLLPLGFSIGEFLQGNIFEGLGYGFTGLFLIAGGYSNWDISPNIVKVKA